MPLAPAPPAPPCPGPRDPAVLRAHVARTLAFYHPRCLDPSGGCFHSLRDDGTVADARGRHLVSSARYVFNYATAWARFGEPAYRAAARHTLDFVEQVHRDSTSGGYAWELDWDGATRRARVRDGTNHCYGLAFVLLAQAHALQAGLAEAGAGLQRTWALLERHFWRPEHALYADEASADWSRLAAYRGQNANMHACEALLAAFDATADERYLHRAEALAVAVTQRLAARAGGLVWEHYHADWSVDWDYHRDDPANLFRPWGFQTGHLTEWAKLLLILRRHGARLRHGPDWLLPRAQALFDAAWQRGWDAVHGGLAYGFAPDGSVCDADKYFWVQAESLAAAGLLGLATGEARYWQAYDRLWRYCWTHFIDHEHGAWWRILTPDNRRYSDLKSPPGKTDYHTMGACHELIDAFEREGAQR